MISIVSLIVRILIQIRSIQYNFLDTNLSRGFLVLLRNQAIRNNFDLCLMQWRCCNFSLNLIINNLTQYTDLQVACVAYIDYLLIIACPLGQISPPRQQGRLLPDWLIIFVVPRFLKRARQWNKQRWRSAEKM